MDLIDNHSYFHYDLSEKGGQDLDIGNKLNRARTKANLTQEQVAEALGVSRQTISNWENEISHS